MKIKDISILKQKVLNMLPITQSEMWKSLGIGRRDGARLVGIMINENLIKRTKSDSTFLLERLNGEKITNDNKEKCYPLLSNDKKFSPCCGCERECDPRTCDLLTEWLL